MSGVAENLSQHSGPNHLVEETDRARKEEKKIDEEEQPAGSHRERQGVPFLLEDADGCSEDKERM